MSEEPSKEPTHPPNTETNTHLEPVNISGDGKVLKYVIKTGDETRKPVNHPSDTSTVKIRVEGKLKNGETFLEEQELEVVLGEGDCVTEGLELAIESMTMGEQAVVSIHPDYCVGFEDVPANSHVEFLVELISFTPVPNFGTLTPEKKYEVLQNDRNIANSLYRLGKLRMAARKYDKVGVAYEFLESEKSDTPCHADAIALRIACMLNRALVLLKLRKWREAIKACDDVRDMDDQEFNVKALLRRGKANVMLCNYDEARADFSLVIEHHPDASKEANNELELLEQRIKRENQRAKRVYKNMFAKIAEENVENASIWEKLWKKGKKLGMTVIVALAFSILAIFVGNITRGRPWSSGLGFY